VPLGRRRRAALLLLSAAASVSLSCRAAVRWQVRHLANDNPDVLYSVKTSAMAVALTIDDGPDPVTTPALLDVLARNEAHATFFIITSRVPGHEGVLRRMVAEGHELGNHLCRDEPSIRLSPEEFERQLVDSDDVLSEFADMQWLRPGAGRYNARMLETLEKYGYRCALGSVYPFDPHIRWSWFSRRFILGTVEKGSVVILHDWGSRGRRTLKTLTNLLPALRERGFRVVTLGELSGLREAPRRFQGKMDGPAPPGSPCRTSATSRSSRTSTTARPRSPTASWRRQGP
jgi:peptidoglycan/xylan/chitin deacetylase (PgdA/CDA1 family)